MILFFHQEGTTLKSIGTQGFAATLGVDADVLCCDRSPEWDEQPGLDEATIETNAEPDAWEIYPTDLPAGRWFDIPAGELDKMRR